MLLAPFLPHGPEILLHPALHLVREDDSVLDVEITRLRIVVVVLVQMTLGVKGHALALDRLDGKRLDDLAALAAQLHDMPIQMRDVARPIAHPRLPQREHLPPEQVPALAPEERAVGAARLLGRQLRLLLLQHQDQIARHPVRALVALVLKHQPRPLIHARFHRRNRLHLAPHNPLPRTHGTRLLDRLALAMARVARHLHLLVHPRRKHVLLDHPPAPTALGARHHLPVRRPRPFARIADLLLLNPKPDLPARVEIPQRQPHPHLHVRSAPVARRMPEVSSAAEKPREQIKGVVRGASRRPALPVLLDSLVSVLIVDFPRGRCREDIVRVCDFDEFLPRRLVASAVVLSVSLHSSLSLEPWSGKDLRILIRMELLAQRPVRALDIPLRGGAVQPQDLVVVFLGQRQDQTKCDREQNCN